MHDMIMIWMMDERVSMEYYEIIKMINDGAVVKEWCTGDTLAWASEESIDDRKAQSMMNMLDAMHAWCEW